MRHLQNSHAAKPSHSFQPTERLLIAKCHYRQRHACTQAIGGGHRYGRVRLRIEADRSVVPPKAVVEDEDDCYANYTSLSSMEKDVPSLVGTDQ